MLRSWRRSTTIADRGSRPRTALARTIVAVLLYTSLTAAAVPAWGSSPAPVQQPGTTASGTSTGPVPSVTARAGKGLALPRIPWEGGPSYWRQFPDARKWANPSFFPIGIWFNGISSDAEVRWDKAHGINFYSGMWEGTDFSLFRRNHVYWVGSKLNSTFRAHSPYWPGIFLDDEVDGRSSTPKEGFRHLRQLRDEDEGKGKFLWANFTQMVIGSDLPVADQKHYVNGFTDAVSLDMYWYTIPFCDWRPYRGGLYAAPVAQSTCRTASSYGRTINSLTIRDRTDGVLQPRWGFVENLDGMSGEHVAYITPRQLRGAAMSAVINEARGLVWFNQSLTGPCQTSAALRAAQVNGRSWCGYRQISAMGRVNNFIHRLAPIINTQSYRWRFGRGLDTMLKVYRGKAYVFAMSNGHAGHRSFTLPPGVHGTSVRVIGEHRTLHVRRHRFHDAFATESVYHVYRVSL